jgi:hypothetical protein
MIVLGAGAPGRDLDAVPAWVVLAADAALEWDLVWDLGVDRAWVALEWAAARIPGRSGPIRLNGERPSPTTRRRRAENHSDFVTSPDDGVPDEALATSSGFCCAPNPGVAPEKQRLLAYLNRLGDRSVGGVALDEDFAGGRQPLGGERGRIIGRQ